MLDVLVSVWLGLSVIVAALALMLAVAAGCAYASGKAPLDRRGMLAGLAAALLSWAWPLAALAGLGWCVRLVVRAAREELAERRATRSPQDTP